MISSYHYKKQSLVLLLALLIVTTVCGQQYSFYYPDINRQLPQQFIYSLATDSQGYLWVGTGEGLVKYDGNKLTPVLINKIPSRNFCAAIARQDKLMVAGFYDGTVAIGNSDNLTLATDTAPGKIVAICPLGQRVFVASQNEIYELQQGKLVLLYKTNDVTVIHGAVGTADGFLLLATSAGLKQFNPVTKKTTTLSNEPFLALAGSSRRIVGLTINGIYTITKNQLSLKYQLPIGEFSPENALALTIDKLYVALNNQLLELNNLDQTSATAKTYKLGDETMSSKAILVDNNQLWIGTYGNGLAYFNPNSYSYYKSAEKQPYPTIALAEIGDNLVEIKANSASLYSISVDGLPDLNSEKIVPLPESVSCAVGNSHEVFLGTVQGNLFTLASDGKLSKLIAFNKILPDKPILSIYSTKNEIYVAVAQNGVYRFQHDGKLIDQLTTANGLLHNDIFGIYTDSQNRTWFLSQSSGLAYLQNNQFKYLTLRDGLSSLEFTDITEDQQHNIWLSTEGGGLTKISPNEIENYNLSSGLSSDYYYGVMAARNRLYTYSRGGINVLMDNQLRKIESNEMGIVPNFQPQAIVVGKKYLAIGSEYGPVVHYLNQLFPQNALKLLVKQALINDDKNLSNRSILRYGDYKMEFFVEQINLNPFFKPTVEYQLVGFDKEWQTLEKNTVIYQSVKDNEYRFVVRDKQFTSNRFDFVFAVEPPFWKKPVYYILFLLLFSVGIYFIFRLRIRQLKQRNKELEDKVTERTIELKRKNNELEQFIFAMSHDLKNPAVNMVELANLLKDVLASNIDMAKEVANQLATVSGKMLNNLLELIDLLKYSNSKELPKENVSIVEIIETVKASISKSIEEANAEFKIDLLAFDHLYFNRSNFQSVMYNLISNAIKYRSPHIQAVIEIKSFLVDVHPAISIRDNGIGIDLEANKERLFGIFQRMHHHVEGTGIGLHLVKSIMEKHGGTIQVESEPGKGSTFTLIFASIGH